MVNWKRVFGALAFPAFLGWYGWVESDPIGASFWLAVYMFSLVFYILGRGKYFEY